jgi:acyl carrier protein
MGTKDGLHEQLAALLADVCGAPISSLGPDAAPGETPGWDSVTNLQFISAIEEEFGVAITTPESMAIKSLDDIARLVTAKRGGG